MQLIADAGTYARVKRGAAWPDDSDLREAIADQQDSFRRALLSGDTDAIKAVVGTDGRELDLERRVRLLAHALDHEPKVRVPFPAVGAVDALDWLLSLVIPGWEPAPWHEIAANRAR